MKTITVEQLDALGSTSITLVDVREPAEYVEAHVPGAQLRPLAQLPDRASDLPADEPVYVICRSGNRSKAGVSLLEARGLDAVNVLGGTDGWIAAGKPVVTGPHAS